MFRWFRNEIKAFAYYWDWWTVLTFSIIAVVFFGVGIRIGILLFGA